MGECVDICNGWVSGFGGLRVIYTCLICVSRYSGLIAVLVRYTVILVSIKGDRKHCMIEVLLYCIDCVVCNRWCK